MTVRALSLAARALREARGRPGGYLLRGGVVLVLLFALVVAQDSTFSARGAVLLAFVVWTNFVVLTLHALASYAYVITEEREQGTLGLLRLAGFTSGSILLGKSAGQLATTLLTLVVQLPFCVLAVTLGGVQQDQVLDVFALLFAYALVAYGIALVSSAVCAADARAFGLCAVLVAAYQFLPWLAADVVSPLCEALGLDGLATAAAELPSWHVTMQLNARAGVRGSFRSATEVWPAVAANFAAAAALFGLAFVLLSRSRTEDAAGPGRALLPRWLRAERWRAPRFGADPIRGKETFVVTGGGRLLLARVVFYGAFFALVVGTMNNPRANRIVDVMLPWGFLFLFLELGVQAEQVFRRELRDRTWGVLVALPRDLGKILGAKLIGTLPILAPCVLLILVTIWIHPRRAGRDLGDFFEEEIGWFLVAQAALVLVVTTWFSLGKLRGAFPRAVCCALAFDVVFVLLVERSRMGDPEELCVFFALCFAVAAVGLAAQVPGRLRDLAGED